MRTFPRHAYIGVLSLLATSACGGDSGSRAEAAALPVPFPVASPEVKTVKVVHEYVAEIRAVRHAELRSRFRGILESVGVDEGQPVKAGQKLFTINARARKQDLAVAAAATLGAAADLHAAELDLENTQLLADKNVVSNAELARTKSKVQGMRARLAQAKAAQARAGVELDRAVISAPFDGVVDRVPHKTGSTIDEDDLLTTISDTREVLAYFAISEREYLQFLQVPAGQRPKQVSLELADETRFPAPGEIDAVGSEIDRDTGTLTYRARFPNPDGVLKHGSSGTIVVETELQNAILVPQRSTYEIQGDQYVFVVAQDSTVHARKIGIKARLEDTFAVDSGLGPGDRFVVEGVQKLKDGMKIVSGTPASVTGSPGAH